MPLNSTHIQRIEFTKVNSHMHSILSLSSLWTQCEFSKLNVNSWVLPEFSYLSSFCAKHVIQKEKIVCAKKRKLSACRWVYQGGTHTLWVYTQLSVDSVSAPGWVYTREFTPKLSWVWVLCLNSPYEFVVGLVKTIELSLRTSAQRAGLFTGIVTWAFLWFGSSKFFFFGQ